MMKIPSESLLFKVKRLKKNFPLILTSKFLKYPVVGEHIELSLVTTTHDDNARPSKRLIDLSMKAISFAKNINLNKIAKREINAGSHETVTIWPGEHYKLLCGFVKALNPKLILEFGTGRGLSALCMKQVIKNGKIATFDLIGWKNMEKSYLKDSDFTDKKIIQYTDDLCVDASFNKHKEMISNAELIFLDGPKDGITEYKLMKKLEDVKFKKQPIIFFDDIRIWHMLKLWRDISYPKIDLVSFGHWSGSGIVEWGGKGLYIGGSVDS